ncbi:MAG: response regulator transcription factor [Anaerolineae bacterium]|nr:response regulator transcription factor [Anaerolineae bacterium]
MTKILVVDDDRVLADVIAFTLRREGYQILLSHDGETALQCWEQELPDIIVLDIGLPKIDGFEVCRHVRAHANTPIILLTVRDEEDDIIHGLDLGADDYITKPFSPRQLVARVRAVLRRASQSLNEPWQQVGNLRLDSSRRELSIDDARTFTLTSLENRLLGYLMLNANRVMTIDALIDHVWGPARGDRDMLRQLIHRLRSKIEPDPSNPIYIETVPGLGYGLIAEPDIDD